MSEASIEVLACATEEDARQLGQLMQDLSTSYDGSPVPMDTLQTIIDRPDSDQLIARLHGRIVGAATLQAIIAPVGSKAWLEDFVVASDESVRGRGVGYALWKEVERWCQERQLSLMFLSSPLREEAHKFYARQGAVIMPTSPFRKSF